MTQDFEPSESYEFLQSSSSTSASSGPLPHYHVVTTAMNNITGKFKIFQLNFFFVFAFIWLQKVQSIRLIELSTTILTLNLLQECGCKSNSISSMLRIRPCCLSQDSELKKSPMRCFSKCRSRAMFKPNFEDAPNENYCQTLFIQ